MAGREALPRPGGLSGPELWVARPLLVSAGLTSKAKVLYGTVCSQCPWAPHMVRPPTGSPSDSHATGLWAPASLRLREGLAQGLVWWEPGQWAGSPGLRLAP